MTVLSSTMRVPTVRDTFLHNKAAYLGGITVLMCSCNPSEVVQLFAWCPVSGICFHTERGISKGLGGLGS